MPGTSPAARKDTTRKPIMTPSAPLIGGARPRRRRSGAERRGRRCRAGWYTSTWVRDPTPSLSATRVRYCFTDPSDAVPALVKALADTDADVREHAADALGHLGEDAAPAADALADLAADEVAAVRLSAVAALGQLGEAAVPGLQRLAGSDDATVAAVAKRFLG